MQIFTQVKIQSNTDCNVALDSGLVVGISLAGISIIVTIIAIVNILTQRKDKENNHIL